MHKVEFQWNRDKERFTSVMMNLWNYDWNELRLFDRYYLKNSSFTKGRNIVLVEFIDDLIQIDKIAVEDLDEGRLALLVEFICKLNEEKQHRIAQPRNANAFKGTVKRADSEYIKINNVIYNVTINHNKKYEWKVDKVEVRGHIRTLKSGKKVFIKSFTKKIKNS